MTIGLEQRRALLDILSKMEEGAVATPRISGEIGLFLREWGEATRRAHELGQLSAASLSGREVGPVTLTPLRPLSEKVLGGPLGDVASTVAAAEELGTAVNVTLWGDARAANQVLNTWVRYPAMSVSLEGAYRWFPPRRLTPGTSDVRRHDPPCTWQTARCLKFVAEDFGAPPNAASYRWDEFFGPPDFRAFRAVVAERRDGAWSTVSTRPDPRPQTEHLTFVDWPDSVAPTATHVIALVVREPWQATWRVASADAASPDRAAAHLITWADVKRELLEQGPVTAQEVRWLSAAASRSGARADPDAALAAADMSRRVHVRARPVAAWLRGLG